MRRPLRPLPLRTSIVDGESLDSWIDALARRNQTGPQDVLRALGFDQPNHSTTQLVDHTALHPPSRRAPARNVRNPFQRDSFRPSPVPSVRWTYAGSDAKPTTTEASGA